MKLYATTVGAQTVVQVSDTVVNTTTATIFASTVTLPTNDLRTVGRVLEWHVAGLYNTDPGPVPSHEIKIDLMSDAVVLATTGAFTTTLASASASGWHLYAESVVTTAGASGALETHGISWWKSAILTADTVFLPSSAVTPFDTTVAHTLGLRVTWTAASVNNSITQRELIIDLTGDRG